MAASFVVYIDESGDEGFFFERGSPAWFVLSAVVTRKAHDLETVKLVDTVRAKLGRPPRYVLHFRKLHHEHRLPFVEEIARARLRTVTVLVHKPSVKEPETFRARNRLYFYAVRLLLERVSWLCRDARLRDDPGDGSAEIYFSNRSGLSYEDLKGYLAHLEANRDEFGVRIAPGVIRTTRVTSRTPDKLMGLQIADAVASSFYCGVQTSRLGFVEDRYARMLRPVVYHHRGTHLGYGVKLWPRECDGLLDTDTALAWVRPCFGGG